MEARNFILLMRVVASRADWHSQAISTQNPYTRPMERVFILSAIVEDLPRFTRCLQREEVQRVTFTGSYNISPAISSDGRWLAYISRVSGAFKLHVMDLVSGVASAITETSSDESPSFAPNSRLIVYATHQQGREALMTTTLDGKLKARLAGQSGDIREPDWGPYQIQ